MKLVRGVGFNDIKHNTSKCPFYRRWKDMLTRCYDKKFKLKYPSYEGTTVCEEWLKFSNFKNWMEKQNWQGYVLDKDIIKPDNKIYSPDNCCFVPEYLNNLLLIRSRGRGLEPLGVSFRKKKNCNYYIASINDGNRQKCIGRYTSSLEAHASWQLAKSNEIQRRISFWLKNDPLSFNTKIAESLMRRSWILMLQIHVKEETTLL